MRVDFSVDLMTMVSANMRISTNVVHNTDFAKFTGSNEIKMVKFFFTISTYL
jgi:hypothetical protein